MNRHWFVRQNVLHISDKARQIAVAKPARRVKAKHFMRRFRHREGEASEVFLGK